MPPLRCYCSGENLVKRTILPLFLIVLAALVAIPNLNIPPAKASGSPPWSFLDDFNYTSISQLQAAGWTTESIAPASYYSVDQPAPGRRLDYRVHRPRVLLQRR